MHNITYKRFTGILILIIIISGCKHSAKNDRIPVAPEQNRRPAHFQTIDVSYSWEKLNGKFSEEMTKRAFKQFEMVTDVNSKGKWKPTPVSIDSHQTPEWFRDAKFGMFIDWGPWSVAGWAPKNDGKAMYPDWYESKMEDPASPENIAYHEKNWGKDFKRDDFIPLFSAKAYDPDKLAKIAVEAGMKYIVPFCKHHGGFCLWPSSYTLRDAGDMGPKRDLVKPLIESCKEQGLKFGFYFSVEEWEYPIIKEDGNLISHIWHGDTIPCLKPFSKEMDRKASGKIAVKDFAKDYIVPQATEFIDNYDPDILWYDGEWSTLVYDLKSYDIAAYFYNKAEGRKEVAVNDRYGVETDGKGLRFRRGDFFTSEFHDHEDNSKTHAWEENRGISQSFGYNWTDTEKNVISTKDFVKMFVDIVSNGGNLLLIVNLDGQGALPAVQENRLKEIGKWIKINSESIYATRTFSKRSEGIIRYTQSKDLHTVYAITTEWPGNQLKLNSVTPKKGSSVYLLGIDEPLDWSYDLKAGTTTIQIPEKLQPESNRPCQYAFTFKITQNK